MKTYLVSQKILLGHIAYWAVAQSPYPCPDNLSSVLEKVASDTASLFTGAGASYGFITISEGAIGDIIESYVLLQHIVKQWNERKNDNQAPYGFSSRYEMPALNNPDNDFIDLGALKRNIINSIIKKSKINQ